MKALWAAAAVLAVLAIGGLPALALTMAADDTGPATDSAGAAWQPGDGAPPWSNGQHADGDRAKADRSGKPADKDAAKAEKDAAKAEQAEQRGKTAEHKKAHGDRGAGHSMNQHGVQMRAWAHCVAGADKPDEAAGADSDSFDPEQACGEKPVPPGQSAR